MEIQVDPAVASLLSSHDGILAEIISYLIHNTRDLANYRLISSEWNMKVLPMALKFSGFIKNCYSDSEHRRRHDFIEGLVSADEDGGAGMKFYFDDEYNGPLNINRPLFDTTGIMKSLLLVSEEQDFWEIM